MSWRTFLPITQARADEEYGLDVAGESWTFRRHGTSVWAQPGAPRPFLELPRLTKLEDLFTEPELAAAGTTRIVASPPSVYLLTGTAPLGLDDVTCGTYDLTWYDLDNHRLWELEDQILDGGEEVLTPPDAIRGPAALFLRRTSLERSPTANSQRPKASTASATKAQGRDRLCVLNYVRRIPTIEELMADDKRNYSTEDFELVDLYVTYNPNEAEFIKDMLDANSIACFIRDLHTSQFPLSVGKHAQVRIVVDEDRVRDAYDLIQQAIADGAITDEGNFVFEG